MVSFMMIDVFRILFRVLLVLLMGFLII